MWRFIVFLLVFSYVGKSASAQEVMFTAQGTAPGVYFYALEVQQDGSVVVRAVEPIPIGDPDNPQPPPPDPPTPPDNVRSKVAQWTRDVNDPQRSVTAAAIALVYRQVAENADIDSVSQLKSLTNSLYNTAMRLVGKKSIWSEWKSKVDGLQPTDLNSAIQMWEDIANGLEDASGLRQRGVLDQIRDIRQGMIHEASCEISNRYGLF